MKQLEKANYYYKIHQYQKALDIYLNIEKESIKNSPQSDLIKLDIASCYMQLKNPLNAEKYYSETHNKGLIHSVDQKLEYIKSLIETGKYKQAKEVLSTIDEGMRIEEILKSKIEFALSNSSFETATTIKSLENFDGYSSYGISIYRENLIFIHSIQSRNKNKPITSYKFTFLNGDELALLRRLVFPNNFNSLSFDYTNNIVFYSGNFSNSVKYKNSKRFDDKIGIGGVNNLTIWTSSLSSKDKSPKLLPYSNIDFSNTHPFVTEDGKTIFFASNMVGGYGDYDLYKIVKTDKGWSRPENLGEEINTFLNEGYPFYSNGVLYFSSEGLPGYGGLDIFKYDFSTKKLENLKKPINSSFDDFYYMHISPQKGFFSSNRGSKQCKDVFYIFERH